jgi:hypothetical protein
MAEATPKQHLEKLRRLSEEIKKSGERIAQKMALTGKSLVQERIQREGFGAEYSKNDIPAFFLYGKARNAAGRKYLEENNLDDDLVSWGEFRKVQGLQNEYVDLTYSGRMFAGLTVIEKTTQGTRFVARLGGSDKEVDEKLDWNSQRYGDFLQPNEAEQKEVDEIVQDEFESLLKKFLD